jgi:hypothetical protein
MFITDLLKDQNNGAYLVRNRGPPGELILALKFKDRPTHHLVKLGDTGFLTVNGKQFGACKTLHEVCRRYVSVYRLKVLSLLHF